MSLQVRGRPDAPGTLRGQPVSDLPSLASAFDHIPAEVVEILVHVEANPGGLWPDRESRLDRLIFKGRELLWDKGGPLLGRRVARMPGLTAWGHALFAEDTTAGTGGGGSPIPPPPPPPPFLGLDVTEERGEVRRAGRFHPGGSPRVVRFETDSAEWRTFLVAYRAGVDGATGEQWRKIHPGTDDQRRRTKSRTAGKLQVLEVGFARGALRLIEIG